MEHLDKKKCICGGRGAYFVYKPANHSYQWAKKGHKLEYGPVSFPKEQVKCGYHSTKPTQVIEYPDGWPDEDLRQWCADMGVPEPEWFKLAFRNSSNDTFFWINKATSEYVKKNMKKDLFWPGESPFSTFGFTGWTKLSSEGLKAEDFDWSENKGGNKSS